MLASLPFLAADPDINLCCYTDAFRMEGLSTIQLRNYLNLGYLSLTEGDMMIKQPLFNLILILPLKLFGTHLIVARITILLFSMTALALFAKLSLIRNIFPLLCFAVLLQYHLFQYTHYAMPDLAAIGMILLSIAFLLRAVLQPERKRRFLAIATLFSILAFFMKQLYFDILLLIPLSLLVLRFIPSSSVSWRDLFYSLLWILVLLVVFLLTWYLPNASFYDHVTARQMTMRFDWEDGLLPIIWRNIRGNLLLPESRIYMVLCFVSFLLGLWEWNKTTDSKFKVLFIAALVFMALEMHKITYDYFPPRYQAGIFFSVGLVAILVVYTVLLGPYHSGRSKKIIAGALLFAFVINNMVGWYGLYERRQYSIQETNNYMKSVVVDPQRSILGSWGPTITWECKSRAIPVEFDLMNDKNTVSIFSPVAAIITESADPQSLNVFLRQGINPTEIADSIKQFNIGHADINLHWVKVKE